MSEQGLSTTPAVNLVENDGYGEGATHTRADKGPEPAAPMPMPLTHPVEVTLNRAIEAELELILLRTDGRLSRWARRLIRPLWLRSIVRRVITFAHLAARPSRGREMTRIPACWIPWAIEPLAHSQRSLPRPAEGCPGCLSVLFFLPRAAAPASCRSATAVGRRSSLAPPGPGSSAARGVGLVLRWGPRLMYSLATERVYDEGHPGLLASWLDAAHRTARRRSSSAGELDWRNALASHPQSDVAFVGPGA